MCGIMASIGSRDVKGFTEGFKKIQGRGPDASVVSEWGDALLGFHRLSIMDVSDSGMQPFFLKGWGLVCNGEIYNYHTLKDDLKDHAFQSGSDCEVLLPLLEKAGTDMIAKLDAEFAFVAYNKDSQSVIAARDRVGIRPLFYGTKDEAVFFASEAKALTDICDTVLPFPPGHYYENGVWIDYRKSYVTQIAEETVALTQIHDLLEAAVSKRLMSDVKVGFLLSGGLDSSLVCALAAKQLETPITTFAIGMETDAIDLKYARDVALKIGSDHHEVKLSFADVADAVKEVIRCLETYDTTTIRASMGMYLLCRYIRNETDIKVILTGEVSDEIFGYKYTDFAPSPEAFQKEAQKRLDELFMYDVLRADRCISSWGLEGRVPFADHDFVAAVMETDARLKMNTRNIGKYLLRQAFAEDDLLPDHILWRQKAAFSDAVGHSMVDKLKAHAESLYPDFTKAKAREKYPINPPLSAEAYWYRELFTEMYPQGEAWIKDYWMPNQAWLDTPVEDPSARVLSNYGESGL